MKYRSMPLFSTNKQIIDASLNVQITISLHVENI